MIRLFLNFVLIESSLIVWAIILNARYPGRDLSILWKEYEVRVMIELIMHKTVTFTFIF